MSAAIDTIGGHVANPSTTFTALTTNSGDSLVIRSFAATDYAQVEQLVRRGATSGAIRIRSPLLYDNVEGYQTYSAETPSLYSIPIELGQSVRPTDTLIWEVTGGASETDCGYLSVFYSNLPGASPRLHMWSDFSAYIVQIKGLRVAVTNSATIGTWTDTVITTTENLLHANTDHAILGYVTDTAMGYVAVKGQETSSLRVGGPGSTNSQVTSDYFVQNSIQKGGPRIPVINSNNANNTYVSTADSAASSTGNVTLIMAELSQNLNN
jgi:hypothetical protein